MAEGFCVRDSTDIESASRRKIKRWINFVAFRLSENSSIFTYKESFFSWPETNEKATIKKKNEKRNLECNADYFREY